MVSQERIRENCFDSVTVRAAILTAKRPPHSGLVLYTHKLTQLRENSNGMEISYDDVDFTVPGHGPQFKQVGVCVQV